ncbi:unnamed protein product [Sphagnum jensenii]|uniref:AP2/ERF domain-containing protein n=1 Tax=Sphagnum jensenii TaxID=128206 RepID=A0ABP1BWD9_9BRYO
MPCRMDFDLNMVPNLDTGMQQDCVQVEDQNRVQQQTASEAAASQAHVSMPVPVYVLPALLFFGQIPADAETIAHFQSSFGSALGSKLDLPAIHRQAHTAAVAAHGANAGAPPPFQSRDIMMSEVILPAYGWSPLNPGFAFPVPHYNGQPAGAPASGGGIMIPQAAVYQPSSEAVNGSECVTDDVDAMQLAEVTNSNDDDDEGNTGNTLLQGADHVDARGRYICEYPSDQLSMVQESMGDAGGGRDIEDFAHDEPPLSSVMEEGSDRGGEGTVDASFQQLQLHRHGSESDSTADDDRDAQAADVAAVLQQPVAAEKKKRKPRKSKAARAANHGSSDTLCNPDVAHHDPAADAASGITTDVGDPATPPMKKKQRVSYRRGPRSKSSEFLGVTHYQRTGRWEAHIWAYDKAALVLRGEGFQDRINFKPAQQYKDDIRRLKLLTKDQMALFLRRDSKGPGAVSTYPCVSKMKNGKFEATYRVNWKRRSPVGELLGSYNTEEEAARAVYDKAVQENNKDMAQLIKDTSVVRSLPTTAQQAAIDAGLPVPSAQKPVTRRRGKQKAPKKPYTPRKKKAAATGAAAKRPRKPYTPRKKKDVVPAGATAAAENDQTLQQVDDATMSENGTNNTDISSAPGRTPTDQHVQLPGADDGDDQRETSVTMSWEQQEVDVQDMEPTPDCVLFNPAPIIVPSYVQADDPVLPSRPVMVAAGNNAAAPVADELPISPAATARTVPAPGGVLIGGRVSSAFRPYRSCDPSLPQILRPKD